MRSVLLHPPYRGIAQRCGQQRLLLPGSAQVVHRGMRGGGFHLQVDAEHNSRYFGTAQRRAGCNGLGPVEKTPTGFQSTLCVEQEGHRLFRQQVPFLLVERSAWAEYCCLLVVLFFLAMGTAYRFLLHCHIERHFPPLDDTGIWCGANCSCDSFVLP